MLGFLKKLKRKYLDDCIEIEAWSLQMDKKTMESYLWQLAICLEDSFPGSKIVSIRKVNNLEMRACGQPLFSGYRLKLAPDVDLKALKRICMGFEHNAAGARIADLDIYRQGKKVSRHDPELNYFVS